MNVGDVVRGRTSKTLWLVEEIITYGDVEHARMTKLEPNGEAPRYVNTSRPVVSLVLVERAEDRL